MFEDFKGVDVNDFNVVVVGFVFDCFNYELFNKVFRYRIFILFLVCDIL